MLSRRLLKLGEVSQIFHRTHQLQELSEVQLAIASLPASLAAESRAISIRLTHDLQQQPQALWRLKGPPPRGGRLSGSKAMSGKTSIMS